MSIEENVLTGRVLIVENDRYPEAETLEQQLTAHGFTVVGIAESVKEAVEKARADKPDIVIMDIRIPLDNGGTDDAEGGIEAARQIQSMGNIGIIYLTSAGANPQLLKKVRATSPRSMFLTKPCSEEQLLADVRLTLMEKRGTKIVFLCYAHEDEAIKVELVKFLNTVKGFGVEPWDDTRIKYGDLWRIEIAAALKRADVAILLISVEFVNSQFIQEIELPSLLKLEGIRIIPVFVGAVPHTALGNHNLNEFRGPNSPTDPLNMWSAEKRAADVWRPLCDQLARDIY